MPTVVPVIFYYLFTAVLLADNTPANTVAHPYPTIDKCMGAFLAFLDKIDADDNVVSGWGECRPVVLTPPHGELDPTVTGPVQDPHKDGI